MSPPPLFRPGHRLKYRSKAIKIWEPQKNTARFSFFYVMHKITILPETKQGCNYRKRGVITQSNAGISRSKSAKSAPIKKNGTELQKSPSFTERLKNNRLNRDKTFKDCQGF